MFFLVKHIYVSQVWSDDDFAILSDRRNAPYIDCLVGFLIREVWAFTWVSRQASMGVLKAPSEPKNSRQLPSQAPPYQKSERISRRISARSDKIEGNLEGQGAGEGRGGNAQ